MPTDPPDDDEPDLDTVYVLPEGVGDRLALAIAAWGKAGRMFDIDAATFDRLAAEDKRRSCTGGRRIGRNRS